MIYVPEPAHAALLLALPCLVADATQIIEGNCYVDESGTPRPGTFVDEGEALSPILTAIRAAEDCVGQYWRIHVHLADADRFPIWIFDIIDGRRQP